MRFAFEEQQLEFRDQMRSFCARELTSEAIRSAWDTAPGSPAWSHERWQMLADMGVVGLTVAEEWGGLGLHMVDLVLLLEEAGRTALPEPLLETTCLGAGLLGDLEGPAAEGLRAEILPRVAAGDQFIAVGLSSQKVVEAAVGADLLLLETSGEIHAVPASQASVEACRALDGGRRPGIVTWEPRAGTLAAGSMASKRALSRLSQRAATGSAAMLVGAADRLIEMAAGYAVERHQFGRPIGSFQAVKHLLADAFVKVEMARPAVYRAAWSIDEEEPSAVRDASMAKACAADAAMLASRSALQVHGAIGYTWEHDLHLWMKRVWGLARVWGDAASHRASVFSALLDGQS